MSGAWFVVVAIGLIALHCYAVNNQPSVATPPAANNLTPPSSSLPQNVVTGNIVTPAKVLAL